jgi:hypothetical protein
VKQFIVLAMLAALAACVVTPIDGGYYGGGYHQGYGGYYHGDQGGYHQHYGRY